MNLIKFIKENKLKILLLSLIYLAVIIVISGFYQTVIGIFIYYKTINWIKLGISLLLTILIGVLVSINSLLVYKKYKERRKCKGKSFAVAGTTAGIVAGVCPLCVTGLLPLIFGLFGIGFSFASLPLQGIEIQLLSIILLVMGTYLIIKN